MKKFARIGSIALGAFSLVPAAVYAQVTSLPGLTPRQGSLNVVDVIISVVNFLLVIAGALAVLFLIIGGVRYIISAGNSDQIESAKHTIFNAIVGVIVIILAFVILNTVKRLLGAS